MEFREILFIHSFNDPPPIYSDLPLTMQTGLSQPTPTASERTDFPPGKDPTETRDPSTSSHPSLSSDSKPNPEQFQISTDAECTSNPSALETTSETYNKVSLKRRKSVFTRISSRFSQSYGNQITGVRVILIVLAMIFFFGSIIAIAIVGGLVLRPYVLAMSFVESICTIASAVLGFITTTCSCGKNCEYTCQVPCMRVKVEYRVNGVNITTKLSKTELGLIQEVRLFICLYSLQLRKGLGRTSDSQPFLWRV